MKQFKFLYILIVIFILSGCPYRIGGDEADSPDFSMAGGFFPVDKSVDPSVYAIKNFDIADYDKAVTSKSITLYWEAPSTIYQCLVMRKAENEDFFSLVKDKLSGACTEYFDQDVEPGKVYEYYISGRDKHNKELSRTRIVSAMTLGRPVNLTATGTREREIIINWQWDDVTFGAPKKINVYRSKSSIAMSDTPIPSNSDSFSFKDGVWSFKDSFEEGEDEYKVENKDKEDIIKKQPFTYQISVVTEDDVESDRSIKIVCKTISTNAPDVVNELTASYGEFSNEIRLTWLAPIGDASAETYKICRRTRNGFEDITSLDSDDTDFEFVLENVTDDKEIEFSVTGVNSSGEGVISFIKGRILPAPGPIAVTNRGYMDKVKVSISDIFDESFSPLGYKIYRSDSLDWVYSEDAEPVAVIDYVKGEIAEYEDDTVEQASANVNASNNPAYYYFVYTINSLGVQSIGRSYSVNPGVAGPLPGLGADDFVLENNKYLDKIVIKCTNTVYSYKGLKVYRRRPSTKPEYKKREMYADDDLENIPQPDNYERTFKFKCDPHWGYYYSDTEWEELEVVSGNIFEDKQKAGYPVNGVYYIADIKSEPDFIPPGPVKYKVAMVNYEDSEGIASSVLTGYRKINHAEFCNEILTQVARSQFELEHMHSSDIWNKLLEDETKPDQTPEDGKGEVFYDPKAAFKPIYTYYTDYKDYYLTFNDIPGNAQQNNASPSSQLVGGYNVTGIYSGTFEYDISIVDKLKTNEGHSEYKIKFNGESSYTILGAYFDKQFTKFHD